MKKFHDLKFFSLVVVLTFALVFMGISLVQGQIKIQKKPDKPPGKDLGEKYEWKAVILDTPFSTLKGSGISSEIPEVIAMADRILVMCRGSITAEFKRGTATQEDILRYAVIGGGENESTR